MLAYAITCALAAAAVLAAWPPGPHHRVKALSARRLTPGADGSPAGPARPLRAALARYVGAAVTFCAARWSRASRERRGLDLAVELCAALAAELRGGRPADEALRRAAASLVTPDGGGAGSVAGRSPARDGPATAVGWMRLCQRVSAPDDVPGVLRRMAQAPGAGELHRLAACWQVASHTGAALAGAVDRVAEGMRADAALRAQVAVQLAGPRATARLLAGLPLVGLLMGRSLGADPLGVLLHTPLGRACLAGGAALGATGWWWSTRLARTAAPR